MADSLTIVDGFRYHADAATAKALLEEQGIVAFLVDAYSADVWTGCIGAVRIAVRPADAEEARALLAKIHATANQTARAEASRVPPAPAGEACLSCGRPLAPGVERCPTCGFAFEGEEEAEYANGRVPASLLAKAWSPIDSHRFGLTRALVPAYVAWCEREHRG